MKLAYVPLSEVETYPRNPKDHDDDLIRASVLRFGFNDPMAINETTGKLLEGHGRLEALRELKDAGKPAPKLIRVRKKDEEWLVPMVRGIAFDTDAEAEAYMVAHNRASESGGWVDLLLGQIMADWDTNDGDLWKAVGFSHKDAAGFLASGQFDKELGELVNRDLNTEERWDVFVDAEIKQIVLYLKHDDYEPTLAKLKQVMESTGTETHTDAILQLLNAYVGSSS